MERNPAKGGLYKKPIISLDLFATTAAIADAPVKRPIDGVNLLPYLTGKKNGTPHKALYWRLNNKAAYRKGDWKILRNPVRGKTGGWELYDLAEDVSEQNDLAKKRTDKVDELLAEWEKLNAEMIDPIWRPKR